MTMLHFVSRLQRKIEDEIKWDSGFKIELPEFISGLQAKESTVEQILNFKDVPDDKNVKFIALRLRGRASTWWDQLQLTRQ